MNAAPSQVKPPRLVLDNLYAFPPNRETLGGTAYLMVCPIVEKNTVEKNNVLVDCPAWNEAYADFMVAQGGVRWLVLTHRGGVSHVKDWQQRLDCEVVVQEQEAYLLPGIEVTEFRDRTPLNPGQYALWTPGHSPGSTCVYSPQQGGVLFTGRHLLPNRQGEPVPLRLSKTFHWPRQLRQVQTLLDTFSADTLHHICPGASLGFLRGQPTITPAYAQLQALDLTALGQTPVGP
ncbi:MAG: MBL fold metallo-hydrolase [Cyanobacteria bacterium P01_A01_bin.105]